MRIKDIVNELIKNKYTKDELNLSCGVYILTLNNKHYIGSCKMLNYKMSRNGFYYRLYLHIYNLMRGKHHSLKLQNAVNKYGINNIDFDIIQECDSKITTDIEQYWLNIMNTFKKGYNSCPTSRSIFGFKHTEKSKLKMSKSKIGKTPWNKGLKGESPSLETRKKLSDALLGRKKGPMSEKQKKDISNTLKNRYLEKSNRLIELS
jgi:group I intron endonuclease